MRWGTAVLLLLLLIGCGDDVPTARRIGLGFGYAAPTLQTFTLAVAPDGGRTDPPDPAAVYYGGDTFLGWHNGQDGTTKVAQYDHATQTVVGTYTLRDIGTPDIHNSPVILVRSSDHKLVVAYSDHLDTRVRVRISSSAADVSAFGSEILAGTGSDFHTYPSLFQLASGTIYLFYRKYTSQGYLAYQTSTDGGATWSGETRLITNTTGGDTPYWRLWSDGGTQIHIAITDTDRTDAHPASVYHFVLEGGALYKSDGSTVSGSLPVLATAGTLVQDASSGSTRSLGITLDPATGRPVILLSTYDSGTPTNTMHYARWTGSAWTVTTIVDVGGVLGGNQYVTGAAMEYERPDRVWVSQKVSGHFEVFRYVTTDSGATWTGVQLTSGSSTDNAWLAPVKDAAPGLSVIWGEGTYTTNTNYSFDTQGAGYR